MSAPATAKLLNRADALEKKISDLQEVIAFYRHLVEDKPTGWIRLYKESK